MVTLERIEQSANWKPPGEHIVVAGNDEHVRFEPGEHGRCVFELLRPSPLRQIARYGYQIYVGTVDLMHKCIDDRWLGNLAEVNIRYVGYPE